LGPSRYLYREKLLRMHRRLSRADNTNNTNENNTNVNSNATGHANNAKIEVDMAHVGEYDPSLLGYLLNFPGKTLPCLETAAVDALGTVLYETSHNNTSTNNDIGDTQPDELDTSQGATTNAVLLFLVLLKGILKATPLRSIKSEHMNRLLRCPGIVISGSPVKNRAIQLTVRCPKCADTRHVTATEGPFGAIRLPRQCPGASEPERPCGMFPYVTVPDESTFVDHCHDNTIDVVNNVIASARSCIMCF
jgi:DNA replication licensing factor MCM5